MKKPIEETKIELEDIIAKQVPKKYYFDFQYIAGGFFVLALICMGVGQLADLSDISQKIVGVSFIVFMFLMIVFAIKAVINRDKNIYLERKLRKFQESILVHKILRDTYLNCDTRENEAKQFILETPLDVTPASEIEDYGAHHVFIKNNLRVDIISLEVTYNNINSQSVLSSSTTDSHLSTQIDGVLLKFNGINTNCVNSIVFDNYGEAYYYAASQMTTTSLKYIMNVIYKGRNIYFGMKSYLPYETENANLNERYKLYLRDESDQSLINEDLINRILKLRFEYNMCVTVIYQNHDIYLLLHKPMCFLIEKKRKVVLSNMILERYYKILTELNEISELLKL